MVPVFLLFTSGVLAQTYNFNSCGSTGRYGPNSGDCGYGGANSVNILGEGIQEWDVPQTGLYRITASGAESGGGTPAQGVTIRGEFKLDSSDTLKILVGQTGTDGNQAYTTCGVDGGGGGGTFITYSNDDPILIAGGGGGIGRHCGDDATFSETDGATGSAGQGGSTNPGGGGGGLNGNGEQSNVAGAMAFVNGGVGGKDERTGCGGTANGGFGGGGGGSCADGGGGGGYSGGKGGNEETVTGGGGSFFAASGENRVNVGTNSGHGTVSIELIATTSDPTIQTPTYTDSQATSSNPARFEVDAHVDIDTSVDSGNTLNSCSATITGDNNGGSASYTGTVSGDNCIFNVDNNDNSNWEPGESVTIDITATDDKGNTDTATFSHSFTNTPPTVNSVTPSNGASSVWGGSNGVSVQADVTDWESVHTNDDLTVDFVDDSLGQFGSVTVSNGDGTASVNWERNGKQDMFGFDRGSSYGWEVNVDDVTASTTTQSQSFTVLSEASTSNPSPTGGESADQMQIDIDNPAVSTDGSLSGSIVEFWVDDGVEVYQVNNDTVSGSNGTASISLQNFDFRNEPQDGTGEWFVKINDTYSETDYSSSQYGSNKYEFSNFTESKPIISNPDPDNSNKKPSDGVPLSLHLEDPASDTMNITFYDSSDDTIIGEKKGVGNGTYSIDWTGLSSDSSYSWYAEVTDGISTTTSSTYSFTTVDLDLSWTDDSGNEDGFNIYSNASGSFQQIKTIGANIESTTVYGPNLEPGRFTCIQIKSYNQYGESNPAEGCITP